MNRILHNLHYTTNSAHIPCAINNSTKHLSGAENTMAHRVEIAMLIEEHGQRDRQIVLTMTVIFQLKGMGVIKFNGLSQKAKSNGADPKMYL